MGRIVVSAAVKGKAGAEEEAACGESWPRKDVPEIDVNGNNFLMLHSPLFVLIAAFLSLADPLLPDRQA